MKLSRLLIVVALACAAGLAALLYTQPDHKGYAIAVAFFVVAAAASFVLSPQIDWWWFSRNPIDVKPEIAQFLQEFFPFYSELNNKEKLRFRKRVNLQLMNTEFMPMVMESVPGLVQVMVAANAVQVSFGHEKWLYSKFENVVLYPHPFPSPQFQVIHSCELFEEDGLLIFSQEQLHNSTTNPAQNFPIALYEYSRAFVIGRPDLQFPPVGQEFWSAVEPISGWPPEFVQQYIGLDVAYIDTLAVAIVLFFRHADRMKAGLPDLYKILENALNLDPTRTQEPVVAPLRIEV